MKTDEQINPVNGLQPYQMSPTDRNRLRWRIRFSSPQSANSVQKM